MIDSEKMQTLRDLISDCNQLQLFEMIKVTIELYFLNLESRYFYALTIDNKIFYHFDEISLVIFKLKSLMREKGAIID